MSVTKKKNVLFIVADDLNSWIGALGRHPNSKTPAIDMLAAHGTLFSKAYCTAPYCNASRMSVFTGCLPSTTGIYQNEPFWLEGRRETFIETFRAAGYSCLGAGKVFHGVFDYATAGQNADRWAEWKELHDHLHLWDGFMQNTAEPMPPQRPLNKMFDFSRFDELSPWNHLFDWGPIPDDREQDLPDRKLAEVASNFLKYPGDQPFFFALGLYKPHLPWYVPRRFFDLYPPESITLPFVREDDLDDVPEIARQWALNPPDHETVLKHGQWRHAVQAYLAAVSYCDHLIGLVLEALAKSPAADNTIVVLWGDNGFHLGEKLHWRKFVLWEEATRVPMIIAQPRRKDAAPIVAQAVSLMDLFPTLADLCGVTAPSEIDGRSLRPLMQHPDADWPHAAITTWQRGNHSVRLGDWRYTRYHDGSEELYNHSSDPFEWTNLVGRSEFEVTVGSLKAKLPVPLPRV